MLPPMMTTDVSRGAAIMSTLKDRGAGCQGVFKILDMGGCEANKNGVQASFFRVVRKVLEVRRCPFIRIDTANGISYGRARTLAT